MPWCKCNAKVKIWFKFYSTKLGCYSREHKGLRTGANGHQPVRSCSSKNLLTGGYFSTAPCPRGYPQGGAELCLRNGIEDPPRRQLYETIAEISKGGRGWAKYKCACTGFFLVTSVLCTLAKTKAGVVLGWRLRDEAVSFPRAVESWAEVRAVKKRWVLGGGCALCR